MAVCNLFRKLSKQTGEFLMFSQYAEDLTRNNSQGYNYRVTPSRFIAANIDFSKFNKYVGEDLNISFPKYLQNYFENGCAVCRNKEDIDWNPEISSNLFWNAMIEGGLLTFTEEAIPSNTSDKSYKYYVNEFKWIGEINIQSYDKMNGAGYSEIYCYIPNSANSTMYGCSERIITNGISSNKNIIEGYNIDEFNDNMLDGSINSDIIYYPQKTINFYHDDKNYGIKILNEDKFDINCIIVLYDINNIDNKGNSTIIYKNIPLGIYLPGCFEDNIITNHITKWVHNSDIYDSGTSYGIRICSRFFATPNSNSIKEVDVNSINSIEFESVSQLLGGMADNLQKMMDITKDAVYDSNLKDTLAIFKNSRTNVPYAVDLNGAKYWFINGRNTGIKIPDESSLLYEPYDSLSEEFWSWVENPLYFDIYYCIDNPNATSVKYIEYPEEDINIYIKPILKQTYKYGTGINDNLNEGLITINLSRNTENWDIVDFRENNETFKVSNIENGDEFQIDAEYDKGDSEIIKVNHSFDFKYCLPIYFGLISRDVVIENGYDTGMDNTIDKLNEIIKDGNKIEKYLYCPVNPDGTVISEIRPHGSNRIQFNTNGGRIVYIYPKSDDYGNELIRILNRNNMDDSIEDFKKEEIIIDTNKGKTEYYMYYTTSDTDKYNENTILDFITNGNGINEDDKIDYQNYLNKTK